MPVARKHGLYAISLGTTILGGISQQNLVTGTEIRGEMTDGEIYARFQSLYAQKIAPGFSTMAIASALDACGTLGVDLSALTGGLALYAQQHAQGGARAAGAVHRKYAFADGILAPRQLSVNHRADATLSYECVTISADGANAPLAITDAVALPAPAVGQGERYTLGPITVGGVALTQVRQLTIDFGIDLVGESADSEIWDTFCGIRGVQTTIRLSGIDAAWLTEATGIPLLGKPAAHADTAIYLRKRAMGGAFVADATEEHLCLTAAGLAYIDQAFSASGNEAGECSLVLPLVFDGTNAPLVIDTAAALPSE